MKNIFSILVFVTGSLVAGAQSVGIGNNTPHTTSILDLSNNQSKALLLPRLSQSDRDALASPPSGTMLYMNSTSDVDQPIGLYYRTGSAWRYLLSSSDIKKTWEKVSDAVQYSSTDRVGIGTTSPTGILHLKGQSDAEQISVKMQSAFPSLSFDYGTVASGSYLAKAVIYGTSTGLVFANSVQSPTASMRFRLGNSDRIILEPDGTFKTKSEIRLTDDSFVEKGFFQMNGDDLRMGTVSSNNTGNVVLRLNGADHFKFENNGRFTLMNDATPTLYFQTGGVNQSYLQQQGDNLTINATGNQVRISNVLYADDGSNRVGIGTSIPSEKLQVQGNIKVSSGKVLNNSNDNLLAYGYAIFRGDGTKARGTSTLTGSWIGNDFYLSATDGSDISDGILSVTCYNANLSPSFVVSGARLKISFFDEDGDLFKPSFSVVLYK